MPTTDVNSSTYAKNTSILLVVDDAIASATNTGHIRSANCLLDAKRALVQATPSTTGVVNGAIGALEGIMTARSEDTNSMDQVLRKRVLNNKGRSMVRALWRYANDHARHILERKPEPTYDDAIFLLQIVAAVIMRALGSMHCRCCRRSSLEVEIYDDTCVWCNRPEHGCDACKRCVDYETKSEHDPWDEGDVVVYRLCHQCLEAELPDHAKHRIDCTCFDCETARNWAAWEKE